MTAGGGAVEVEVEADAWLAALPDLQSIAVEAARAALATEKDGESLEVSLLFADDAELRRLNATFRDADRPTNVLAFPAEPLFRPHLGDVALAFETCAQEAEDQHKPLANHVRHLVVHGVLHLLGWDHGSDSDAETMERLERDVLRGLGVADPYAQPVGTDHAGRAGR